MATDKCSCGKDKESWMEICKQCYAIQKNGSKPKGTKERDIKRQVFLKVASEQNKGSSPHALMQFAKDLEKEFNLWA